MAAFIQNVRPSTEAQLIFLWNVTQHNSWKTSVFVLFFIEKILNIQQKSSLGDEMQRRTLNMSQ